jgi:phosphate uptake regulator
MSDDENEQTPEDAASERLRTLVEAFDNPDPDDDAAMWELNTAKRRLSEHLVREVILPRPEFHSQIHGRVPEIEDGGPPTVEEAILWALCVRYEHTAGLLRVYVGEELIHELPIITLRQNASLN